MLNIIKKINKILDEVVPRGGAYDGKRCDLLKFGNSKKTTNERLNKLSRSFAVFLMFFLIFSTTAQAAFVEPTVGPASSDQDFLQNILGANNANNDFDSSSVVSNADGSLIERLQYIVEAITSLWTKSGNDLYYITGNVGIGTTTPQYGQLEVKPTAGNSATGITLNDGTNATARSWIGSGDLWHMTRGSVATNGITMDTSGNIGIGTTSVSTYKLNVHGSLYADDIYTSGSTFYMGGNPLFTKSNSTLDFGVETDESINFTINDSSVMKVDTSGNVGIGTTTPATKLDIYSTTSGILLPRMTTTQRDAISSPTESEIVYNTTDDELQYYSSSSSWSTLGGGSTTIDVTQSSHGLSVGNVVRSSGTDGQYTKAQADSTSNVEVIGIVTEVADANNFTITVSGPVTVADAVPNLTAGTALFLATTTAGALTSVEPTGTGEVSKPIAIVTTANSEMIFFNMRGVEVTTTDSYIATLIEDTTPQLGGALDVNGQQITSVSNGNIVLMPNGTGNVGIGTAGPGYKLDVNGDARIGGDFTVTGTSYLGNIQISADNITSKQITAADGDGLKLYEDGGAGIFVQDGGNVGIGTTAPLTKLQVNTGRTSAYSAGDYTTWSDVHVENTTGTVGSAIGISFLNRTVNDNNGSAGIAAIRGAGDYEQSLAFITRPNGAVSAEQMRISSTGNVGIGTTAPGAKLDVVGGDIHIDAISKIYIDGGSDTYFYESSANNYKFIAGTADILSMGSNGIIFNETGYDRDFRIESDTVANAFFVEGSSGNVGIGTTAPGAKLEVVKKNDYAIKLNSYDGTLGGWTGINIARGDGAIVEEIGRINVTARPFNGVDTTASRISTLITAASTAGEINSALTFSTSNSSSPTERVRIDNNGNVGIGTTSPLASLSIQGSGNNVMALANSTGGNLVTVLNDGNVGIGTTAPGNKLDIITGDTTNSGFHFGEADNQGGYLSSYTAANLMMSAGSEWVSNSWTARATSASLLNMDGGGFTFYSNTGLTPGNTFAVTEVAAISGTTSYFKTGNVGIGTTSPYDKLEIGSGGDIALRGTGILQAAESDSYHLGFNSGSYTDLHTGSYLTLSTDGIGEAVRITSTGNVGIGTTAPGAVLQVGASSINNLKILSSAYTGLIDYNYNGDSRVALISNTNEYLGAGYSDTAALGGIKLGGGSTYSYITAGSSNSLLLNPITGNVGIGTTAPNAKLQIGNITGAAKATYGGNVVIFDNNLVGETAVAGLEFAQYVGAGTEGYGTKLYTSARAPNSAYFDIATRYGSLSWTPRLTIDSLNGNVGIGTTAPLARLHLDTPIPGTVTNTGWTNVVTGTGTKFLSTFVVGDYINVGGQSQVIVSVSSDTVLHSSTGWTNYTNAAYTVTKRSVGAIFNSGNVGIGTTAPGYKLTLNGQPAANGYTAWTNYSDRRLKDNVIDLITDDKTNILDKISKLRPVTFNYNELTGYDEETRSRRISGFIAQELQEIFPQMVATTTINGTEYLDTNLSDLSLYLVEGMKEQQEQIKELKVENDELKQEKDIQITNLKKEKDIQVGNLLKMIKKLQAEIELLKE